MTATSWSAGAGVLEVSLQSTLVELTSRLGCRFCLETLILNGPDNMELSRYVDYDAIVPNLDVVAFIEVRYPGFKVQKVQGQNQLYRVYDVKILQCQNYALDSPVTNFTFEGMQQDLIARIVELTPNTCPYTVVTPEQMLYVASDTKVSVKVASGTIRDVLIAGCSFPRKYSILWQSVAAGTLAKTLVTIGFAGVGPTHVPAVK